MKNQININFWKNKRVFITGHTGFKGTWLSIILNLLNCKIYGYSLRPEFKSLFNQSKIKKEIKKNYFSDINNLSKLRKAIKSSKPDVVFHLAAQPLVLESYKDPINTLKTNILGTVNLLESIKNVGSIKSVVIITTDKVYKIDKNNKKYVETDELGGIDPYSASKASAELVVSSYINSFYNSSKLKNRVSTARAGNVIGGGDYSKNRLLPDIIKSLKNNKTLKIRNPNSIRPWQHVIDPLVGYLLLAEKQQKKDFKSFIKSWNFGPKKSNFKKVIDIVKILKNEINFKYSLAKSSLKKETKVLKLNSKKAEKTLNWISKWNIKTSLKKTIEWNLLVSKGISAKKVCEKQFMMYINRTKIK